MLYHCPGLCLFNVGGYVIVLDCVCLTWGGVIVISLSCDVSLWPRGMSLSWTVSGLGVISLSWIVNVSLVLIVFS